MERVSEITFNASLLRELHAIDFVNRLLAENRLDRRRYRPNRMHRIEAVEGARRPRRLVQDGHELELLPGTPRRRPRSGGDFLRKHYADVGVRATLDLREEFL